MRFRISTIDCRTSEEPFLGRQDTGHLPVCCTIQNKAQGLKAVEETAEGLQRLKTAEGMVDGLSLAENCGGFWTSSPTSKGRKEMDDRFVLY